MHLSQAILLAILCDTLHSSDMAYNTATTDTIIYKTLPKIKYRPIPYTQTISLPFSESSLKIKSELAQQALTIVNSQSALELQGIPDLATASGHLISKQQIASSNRKIQSPANCLEYAKWIIDYGKKN